MLGDDFSISNQVPNFFQGDRSTLTQGFVDDIYINQRRFLALMANSTALFPVNGNHEEARRSLLGTPLHEVSIFAGRARNRYFPVPTADEFYSGNPEPVSGIGLLGDYFAFEWGDAQHKFVFTHHVLGTGRGGIERAIRYEWGGYTDHGEWEFDTERPNWELSRTW
jgi:hypothetical protein